MMAHPILFSGPMVRALLDGRKTQTRRALRPQPDSTVDRPPRKVGGFLPVGTQTRTGRAVFMAVDAVGAAMNAFRKGRDSIDAEVCCPYGAAGDLLIVREAHHLTEPGACIYRANWREDAKTRGFDNIPSTDANIRWRPSIHMRRRDSRLTLEVTEVRVERLQDISEADAMAEGAAPCENGVWFDRNPTLAGSDARGAYYCLWMQLNGMDSWAENPWVWAVSFNVHRQNVDALLSAREAPHVA